MEENTKDYFSKDRMNFFSDGIFAILMTILVLELKVPQIQDESSFAELWKGLVKEFPKLFGWLISFFALSVIWVNHYRLCKQFKVIDHTILWLNTLLLMFTAFIPFPTALIGDYPNNQLSIILYGFPMICITAIFPIMRLYAIREGNIFESIVPHRKIKIAYFWCPASYALGVCLSFIHVYLAYIIFLVLPIVNMYPRKLSMGGCSFEK